MNEINCGSLFEIVGRIKQTRGFARSDDFTIVPDGNSSGQPIRPLMYCVDFKAQQVIYTVHDPEDIRVTLAEPFLFLAQLRHAKQILSLPIQHIGRTISNAILRPTFIFSTGRAGSTHLIAMLKAIGRPTASEPDAFTQMAMLPPSALERSPNIDMQIMAACVSNLSDYLGPKPIIKLRSQCNAAPERIIKSVENARAIFLLRDRKTWALSRHRAFREPPKRIANILVEAVMAIDRLQHIGASAQVIWYDDLVAHPWATLAKILMGSPLKPSELDARLTATLAADSQAGTALAQGNVARNQGNEDFMDQFEVEWAAAQPREVIDRLGLRI
jgi:hypothetical protein